MRSVALSVFLVAAAASAASADEQPKPTFSVSSNVTYVRVPTSSSLFCVASPPTSRHLSSSSSPMTGQNGGHPQKPPRRPLLVVRPGATLASGKSKMPNPRSSRATRASSPSQRLPTTPSLLPSARPSTSRLSLWSSNTKSSTRRVVTAVVVTSNFWKTASRPVARTSRTRHLGWLCSVLI